MRWMRIGLVAAFLLAAIAAAVAGGLAREDAAEPSDAPELTATAEIRRSFMEPGTVAIAVTNHGDAPVRVVGVELVGDSFAPLGRQEVDANVPPSVNPRDLLIQYGEANCPDGIDSVTGPSSVALSVETEDGAAHEVTAELPHPNGTLDRLLREACGAEYVEQSVELELGELTAADDGGLEGPLGVRPLNGAAIELVEVRGSVLFEISAVDLSGDTVPLGFDAHRCEGHAVGDAKQPFAFNAWIAVDGAEPLPAPLPVSEGHEQALWAMLEERCGHDTD